jgi:hypothetical protein
LRHVFFVVIEPRFSHFRINYFERHFDSDSFTLNLTYFFLFLKFKNLKNFYEFLDSSPSVTTLSFVIEI